VTRAVLVLASAALTVAMPAAAHDTWIVPVRDIPAGKLTILNLTSGTAFPSVDDGPKADRVVAGGWRLGDRRGPIGGRAEGDSSLALAIVPVGQGTVVVWLALGPKEIDLTDAQVGEYLDEIDASDDIRRAWENAGPNRQWHETYVKTVTTFARASGVGDDASCLAPAGDRFQLVPDRDPTGLVPGDTLTVRAMKNGKGMGGAGVGAMRGGSDRPFLEHTNPAGYVRVPIDGAGPWLIRATDLRPGPDGTWESDFATMTFIVAKR
jgi:uncharacterized GH25 family protein